MSFYRAYHAQAHKTIKAPEGKVIFLGDVHGDPSVIERCLEASCFNEKNDIVISVGDLIDKGPDSLTCLSYLDKPWFHSVMGNHESLLIENFLEKTAEGLAHWFERNGGSWFGELSDDEQVKAFSQIINLPLAITVNLNSGAKVGVCHAEPEQGSWSAFINRLSSFDINAMHSSLWSRDNKREGVELSMPDVSAVVVGHNSSPNITQLGNVLYIDTALYGQTLPCITDAEIEYMLKQSAKDTSVTCSSVQEDEAALFFDMGGLSR